MSPALLVRIGAITKLPGPSRNFKPETAWVNKYRIHTCNGYVESGNENVGVLRLERIPGEDSGFTLKVRQRIVNSNGEVHTTDAGIRCMTGEIGSPAEWSLASRFEDVTGRVVEDLTTAEGGQIQYGKCRISRGSDTQEHASNRPVTADWLLFEAIQRLPREHGDSALFDYLEGLSVVRLEHRLSYLGEVERKADRWPRLHRFVQFGHGVLPYNYWLGADRRLLLVTSLARAYILDDAADEKAGQRLNSIRKKLSRRSNG